MGWENTVTEKDIDDTSLQFVQGLHVDGTEGEPDLTIDGLSESFLSWLLRLLRVGRS